MKDEWHIRIETHYLDPVAGSGARAKERQLSAGKGSAQRFLDRITDARTDDRSWRRGAEGEERVASILARSLPAGWVVVHDLTIGSRGANLDHLLIGPGGVFTLNTKNLTGRLTVYDRAILQNGQKTAFVPSALREARTVQDRLSSAAGQSVSVWGVIVLAGRCEVQVKSRPSDLTIVSAWQLPGWIAGLPARVLTAGDVLRFERAARDPATWQHGRRQRSSARPAAAPATGGSQPPPPRAGDRLRSDPRPVRSASSGAVTINRWRRHGKDRFYANAGDGTRLGFIDVPTGEVVLEVADGSGVIAAQLRAARRAVVPPTSAGPA